VKYTVNYFYKLLDMLGVKSEIVAIFVRVISHENSTVEVH